MSAPSGAATYRMHGNSQCLATTNAWPTCTPCKRLTHEKQSAAHDDFWSS